MSAAYPIRPITESEFPEFCAVPDHAFNSNRPPDEVRELDRVIFEIERSLAAFDAGQIVGSAAAQTFRLTVPGGIVDAAGVTFVAVLPSHRRRGILTAMMTRQIEDVRDRGEPVAALFASESGIYGRFGYGVASQQYSFSIKRGDDRMIRGGPGADRRSAPTGPDGPVGPGAPDGPVTLRLADPAAAHKEMEAVFNAVRVTRPGMFARNDGWWQVLTADPEFMRDGASALRCVIAADDAGARGYAMYNARPSWGEDSLPSHVLTIEELFAADLTALSALWANLLGRDLVGEVRTRMRPIDDPLLFLLADSRRARPRVADGMWIRLIDVPTALSQRRYACPIDVVIEVTDDLLPANAGRWRLRSGGPADPDPAVCERTTASAQVGLPVASLGAAYLGGTRLGSLAGAGLAAELDPGALFALSASMAWDPQPWAATMF